MKCHLQLLPRDSPLLNEQYNGKTTKRRQFSVSFNSGVVTVTQMIFSVPVVVYQDRGVSVEKFQATGETTECVHKQHAIP